MEFFYFSTKIKKMYNPFMMLCLFFICTNAKIEIDIDRIDARHYNVTIDNKQFMSCTPKNPPSAHGWSVECEEHHRSLRVSCTKCYSECGGDVPVAFPDAFCQKCIPQCYS